MITGLLRSARNDSSGMISDKPLSFQFRHCEELLSDEAIQNLHYQGVPRAMRVKYGQQRRLAETVGVSPQVLNDYLAGRCNASPRQARRLGEVTATDPFIWLLPDDLDARPAAVAAWATEESEGAD